MVKLGTATVKRACVLSCVGLFLQIELSLKRELHSAKTLKISRPVTKLLICVF